MSDTKNAGNQPPVPPTDPPQPAGIAAANVGGQPAIAILGDIDDLVFKPGVDKILARRAVNLQTDVLKISPPRAKLDPIAVAALKTLRTTFKGYANSPESLEREVRDDINSKGIASRVKKVTDRLNARHMTDGRRWVLATTYVHLLSKLISGEQDPEALKRLMKDDLGVAERLMLDLEAKDGPFEAFANQIVELVVNRNRVRRSPVFSEIVSQQVRAAI